MAPHCQKKIVRCVRRRRNALVTDHLRDTWRHPLRFSRENVDARPKPWLCRFGHASDFTVIPLTSCPLIGAHRAKRNSCRFPLVLTRLSVSLFVSHKQTAGSGKLLRWRWRLGLLLCRRSRRQIDDELRELVRITGTFGVLRSHRMRQTLTTTASNRIAAPRIANTRSHYVPSCA